MRLKKMVCSALTVCLFVVVSSAALAKDNGKGNGNGNGNGNGKGKGNVSSAPLAKDNGNGGATILETLERTDGSQALVAAIRFVDAAGVCSFQGQLLNDKKEELVFFAPSNGGFEKFLKLPDGGFDGMNTDAIVLAFPGLLNKLELTAEDVCDVLQNHVADTKHAKKMTASRLLKEGGITVTDGALFPIAVGDVGPSINYVANITERDVFTVNGIIHYIDNVIVEPEEEPEVDPSLICNTVDACAVSGPSRTDCQAFVLICESSSQDQQDCVQGATLICVETELGGI
jgi:uncharacterized surface protein with fasciclin (FAS1) repeats